MIRSVAKLFFLTAMQAILFFTACNKIDTESPEEPIVTVPSAVLDLSFNDDGTASDISENKISVTTMSGASMVTYHNEAAGRNAVRFFNGLGSTAIEGYYKIDYYYTKVLREALKNGHSIEVQFMLAEENPGVNEVKMFSGMDAGGTGIMLTSAQRGKDITFLPNVSTGSSSNWIWTQSGIVPETGRYYHVVGVWDSEAQTSSIYVNGELKKTVPAKGKLILPTNNKSKWFCVGGDATPTYAESSWNGDVVIARIYDEALDEEQVKQLWKEADKDFQSSGIKISDVLMLPVCNVRKGGTFTICANGFDNGDAISLEGTGKHGKHICSTTIKKDKAIITIPDNLEDDTYKIFVVRGEDSSPIGSVQMTVGESETAINAPGVIAHRGAHCTGVPENSIAALKRAQEMKCYGSETDVWITTDGQLFINHDGKISGKTIQDCTAAELEGITLSNGEPLPTFEQYLEQAGKSDDTKLVIEIKEHHSQAQDFACVDAVLDCVTKNDMDSHVDYISFSLPVCKRIAAAKPEAMVGYLLTTSDIKGIAESGIGEIDFTYTDLFKNPEYFETARELGMKVNIWTIDSRFDMMRAIGYGADYITTNSPETLFEITDRLF